MDKWQYLLLLGGCLLITLPLEFLGEGVYRQPRRRSPSRWTSGTTTRATSSGWALVTAVLLLWERQEVRR